MSADKLGRTHLIIGLAAIAAFVISGWFLRLHHPPLPELDPVLRIFLRSRHLYLMFSGAVNVCLGLYFTTASVGWRWWTQRLGSGLLLLSPFLLGVAFWYEPNHFKWELTLSPLGLYATFGGTFLHFLSQIGKPLSN
ncbi:MAG: hypothetical protein K1Y36_10920 [Blastocatellia bacterium]|nr:hypothetical protein [Blastocatellia bacterium]